MKLAGRCHVVTKSAIQNTIGERLTLLKKKNAAKIVKDPSENLESMLSSLHIRSDKKYESYEKARCQLQKYDDIEKERIVTGDEVLFPFKTDLVKIKMTDGGTGCVYHDVPAHDRGFYCKRGLFCDEYVVGSAADIPDEEMNEAPYYFYNVQDSVENMILEAPSQLPLPKKYPKRNELDEDAEMDSEMSAMYGNVDLDYKPEIEMNCVGCGAKFHCHDVSLPGFLPVELLHKLVQRKIKIPKLEITERCRRCYMLKNYDFLLNVNVSPVDYRAVMGHLKLRQDVLILLIVDMTDIRGSILSQLPQLIGHGKNVMVAGNKMDLLPPDARAGYLKNFRDVLNYEIERAGLREHFSISKTALVSAKTGYGVEDLITSIFLEWVNVKGNLRSDIYMVGATNVGKSTLFNSFIQSDLCKIRAQDLVERVTTSIWPGTTLSLLKFPLMNPSTRKLELRRRRLLSQMNWKNKESKFQRQLYLETRNPRYLSLSGIIESTFKEEEEKAQAPSDEDLQKRLENNFEDMDAEKRKPKILLNGELFKNGFWCYDTPGTVNPDQILDLLTLEELVNVIPKELIVPRSVVLQKGWSLLVGGLGRIDVLEVENNQEAVNRPVYMTVYASHSVKLEALKTEEINEFLDKNIGKMGVPIGGKNRLEMLPEMKSKDFLVKTVDKRHLRASEDVLLSSLGWVSISSIYSVKVRAFTPGGRGLGTRPSLLKFAVDMRGSRIPGTRFFTPKITPP
ncbi:unnamed protein product [Bursaphelenchus xylophilus]|uniref:(pine wood nematode) hypothetical protein n=1 Tax=Bursaphelenchus xylophilus TaxID=6326 RepID=A0A1I7SW92_BURXY|nr:unnamed protein product [Bursaphelenchus xylophilus]CAG9099027.1 unnamed protein product [Bursaphelenchus xylophilus]